MSQIHGFTSSKRFLPALMLAFFFFTLQIPNVSAATVWDGVSAADPQWNASVGVYDISTPAQLAGFRDWVNAGKNADASYRLTADIDLGGHEWTPIGIGTYQGISQPATGAPFRGKFDGNGHAISDFKVSSDNYQREVAGLFGFVKPSAPNTYAIRGLTVSGARIDVKIRRNALFTTIAAGGLVGYQEGTLRIENCAADVAISADTFPNSPPDHSYISAYAGGLIGFAAEKLIVSECSATGSIRTNVNLSVDSPEAALSIAGGLIGFAGPELEIANSNARADVFAEGPSDLSVRSYIYAGGIVGSITYPAGSLSSQGSYHLKNLFASGSVYSSGIAGGLAGYIASSEPTDLIENSFSDVDVVLAASPSVPQRRIGGGLVGTNNGAISASAAFGNVSGGLVLGGLIGENYSPYGIVKQSYSTGNVRAGTGETGSETYVGGLVGKNDGTFEDCYARGGVDASAASGSDAVYVGGLAGWSDMFAFTPQTISKVYAYGNVKGGVANNFHTGGLIGLRSLADSVADSTWRKPADGSANASIEIATGLNSINLPGDSDLGTEEEIERRVSPMDIMTPEGEAIFSSVKGWNISSAASVAPSTTWTWSPLDDWAAPVLRIFYDNDSRTRLKGNSVSISPKNTIIGPGEIKLVRLLALGFQPQDVRVSPVTLGGVAIEATADGTILLRAPSRPNPAAGTITVSYMINGYEQPQQQFSLTVLDENTQGGGSLQPATFQNELGPQIWVKNVPIPAAAFSVTQPDSLAAIWTSQSGLPRGVSQWVWSTYTSMGGIEQLEVSLNGKPATAESGTVNIEAMVYSYSPGVDSYPTSSTSFPYTVLDDGSPSIAGLPTAVQAWERGVAITPVTGVQIDKGVGGRIANVTIDGLPPGVSATLQPVPSDAGADSVTVEISGTPEATATSGKIGIEATATNGAVTTGALYYRMADKGDPHITGVPVTRQDWVPGKAIVPFKIRAIQNGSPVESVEIVGLPDGVVYNYGVKQPDRVEITISGTPRTEDTGRVEIFARTAGGASYAKFDYSVAQEGRPLITRVPTLTQQWQTSEQIVPVAVRIQGRNNVRITDAQLSGLPDGLFSMTSHVSSTDIWIAMVGSPADTGNGNIEILAETENGETATASFAYIVGQGAGNTIRPVTQLPSGIDLGLVAEVGAPITNVPPGGIFYTYEPNKNGKLVDADGNPLPPGVLMLGYDSVGGSYSIWIDLNDVDGNVLALEYEVNLLDHPFFTDWPNLGQEERLERLEQTDSRLVYEYAENAVTRNTVALLIGSESLRTWPNALSESVIRLTDVGLAVRYVVTDRDMDPFVSAGFLIIPDGNQDNYLIDPLWFLVRSEQQGGSSSGCSAGHVGLALAGMIILAVGRRTKKTQVTDLGLRPNPPGNSVPRTPGL